jgi:hypothetical protein
MRVHREIHLACKFAGVWLLPHLKIMWRAAMAGGLKPNGPEEPGGAAIEIKNSAPAGNEVVGIDKIRELQFRNQLQDNDRALRQHGAIPAAPEGDRPNGAHFKDFRIEQ